MIYITTRVEFESKQRESVVAFGLSMLPVIRTQPGLEQADFWETGAPVRATEIRMEWRSLADFDSWEQSEDYRQLFQGAGAYDFDGCVFSAQQFERVG